MGREKAHGDTASECLEDVLGCLERQRADQTVLQETASTALHLIPEFNFPQTFPSVFPPPCQRRGYTDCAGNLSP